MTQRFAHMDAAESVFFARELERIKAQSYDIKYPSLMARQFIPVSNEAPSGTETITYRQYDRVGRAKAIAKGATDLPRVDVKGLEFTRPVRWYGDSYGWNLVEIRQSQLTGRSLDSRKAAAARRAWEEIVDYVACFGDAENGIATGFLNDAAVTPIGPSGGAWASASADDIITDVTTLYGNTLTGTEGIEKPDTLLLDDAAYHVVATKPRSTTSDTTVMRFLLDNFPYLTSIMPWYRCATAGAAGVTRAVLYKRSPEYLQQEIPNEFEQLPVYQRGLNFEVGCIGCTAGTQLYYPLAVRYMDGV
jgi:hypothetical protein